METKKKAVILMAVVAFLLTAGAAAHGQAFKVGAALPGFVNDNAWNAAAYKGLTRIKEKYNAQISYQEMVDVAAAEGVIREYARAGYNLVFCHTFPYEKACIDTARRFPKTAFMWAGFTPEPEKLPKNLALYGPALHEPAYLAGLLAGKMTKTNRLGLVAGFEIPEVKMMFNAFKMAATKVNPKVEMTVAYVGTFTDVEGGKKAALSLIAAGADIVYGMGNGVAIGTILGAKEGGKFAIGSIGDMNPIAPGTVLTSTMWNLETVMLDAAEKVQKGTFETGFMVYDMRQGGADIAPYHEAGRFIPEDVKEMVAQARKDILEGKLQVPKIFK